MFRSWLAHSPFVFLLAFVWWSGIARAQQLNKPKSGKELFEAGCAGCHGMDGHGQKEATLGFAPPETMPDFPDCNTSSREPDSHWYSVIRDGGPARAFIPVMPSFRELLTEEETWKIIAYLRSLCTDRAWPSGNLNLPRPLRTGKAFPEDEIVLTGIIDLHQNPGMTHQLTLERRFGARNNFEFRVPGNFKQHPSGTWFGSVGDISFEYKRVAAHSNRHGSVLSWAAGARLPTANHAIGFGSGVAAYEGLLAYNQLLKNNFFLLSQVGAQGPAHRHQLRTSAFWRGVVGKTFSKDNGIGRMWSPMVELVAARALGPAAHNNYDVVPQMQVTLSKRQHIRFNAGFNIPVTNTVGRPVQLIFYLLWDSFDGGLREGWR